MRTTIVSGLVILTALGAQVASAAAGATATSARTGSLHGQVLVVPNIFMCVRPEGAAPPPPPCNAYRGPIVFCAGSQRAKTPCAHPTATTRTNNAGRYQVLLPYGRYSVYLQGPAGWQTTAVTVDRQTQTENFTVRRFGSTLRP